MSNPIILDIACGKEKLPGAIGIDRTPFEGVDVVRDLMRGLPFADDTADAIRAKHILEHFDGEDLIFLIEELWRVSKAGAQWQVVVPSASSPNRYRDPTHKTRDWSEDSFLFWAVDDQGEHLIHRGPDYRANAKLHLIKTWLNDNRDRFYELQVIK